MTVIIFISLPNYSDTVRWSVDLRWQRPSDPIGFYDLKDGVLLRSSKDPNMKINWEPFDSVNRHDVQIKAVIDEVDKQFYLFILSSDWDLHMFYLSRVILFSNLSCFTRLCTSNISRYSLEFALYLRRLWQANTERLHIRTPGSIL